MNLILFLLGLAVAIFSHPKVTRFFMNRLINEGIVAPKLVKTEDAEVIKYAGPNLSLLFIGIILMIISFIV